MADNGELINDAGFNYINALDEDFDNLAKSFNLVLIIFSQKLTLSW
jgi:hypothetical protein